jgi:spore germination protein YaaH
MRTVVPIVHRRLPVRSSRLALVVGTLVLVGLLPGRVDAVEVATVSGPASPGIQPTVQYEEALAHAGDRISFTPGGRVTVPFTPRASDRWAVDGASPVVLPSGRVSGTTMRDGPTAAAGPANDAVAAVGFGDDRPSVDPSTLLEADAASWDGTGGEPTFDLAAAVDPGGLRREVFGFLPYWELADSSTRLDWEKISTVAYFGVGADGKGNLQKRGANGATTVGWSGWTSSRMTNVINAAHRSGARVVLTVQSFAWTSTQLARQKSLLGSPTYRNRLARQIALAVRDRGADGVNLDFEPIASGYADEFTSLVRAVRSQLNRVHKGYQLTFDTTGWIGNYPIRDATARGAADAVVVMGYDYRTSGSTPVGSLAPIGGPSYDVSDTVAAFVARIPASKVILGVPYYGRAWSTAGSSLHSKNISGTKYGASVAIPYATAREFALAYGRKYDPVEGVSWIAYRRENCTTRYGCVTPWRQLYYDDVTALKAKYDLVNRAGLRGVGIWALGYDGSRPELYAALKAKFITDKVPPVITAATISGTRFSPDGNGHGDAVTMRLTATGLVRWGYSVAPVSGTKVGKAIRGGSVPGRRPSFTWTGTGPGSKAVKDGRYRITLWAADASNNRSKRSFDVMVDRKRATITPSMTPAFLTPGVAGPTSRALIGWTSTEPLSGTVSLLDPSGGVIRRWTMTARAAWTTGWTGTRPGGGLVRDGRYRLHVDGFDAAGNRTVRDGPVLVDRTIRAVTWSATSFDPRGRQTARATVSLLRDARIKVGIYHGRTLVRTIWADRAAKRGASTLTWDGKTSAGSWVAPGTYRVVVRAMSPIGTTEGAATIVVRPH